MERNEQTLVNFKLDSEVKESAEAVLASMGLSMSTYLGMSLRMIAQDRKIPFDFQIDPEFWVNDAKASKAAEMVKSGLFGDCWNLLEEISDEFSIIVSQKIMKKGVKDDVSFMMRYLIGSFGGINISSKIVEINAVRNYLGDDVKSIDKGLLLIEDMLTTKVKGFTADHFPNLSNDSYEKQAKAVEDTLGFVVDTYSANKDQMLLRFVGSESYAVALQHTINAINARVESAKASEDKRQEEFDKSYEQTKQYTLDLIRAMNADD